MAVACHSTSGVAERARECRGDRHIAVPPFSPQAAHHHWSLHLQRTRCPWPHC